LGSNIRQQLQQAGVLQHVAVVMAALAARLRSKAAAIGALSGDELVSRLDRFGNSSGSGSNLAGLVSLHMLHRHLFQ
jgi:hypothetical protein